MNWSPDDRAGALDRAAATASAFLAQEGDDLNEIAQGYIEARSSGRHAGRRIPEEMATSFAVQFQHRADAVLKCSQAVAGIILALKSSGPLSDDEDPYQRAAHVAGNWLDGQSHDHYETFERYIVARRTGVFDGHPIDPDLARSHAVAFQHRCDAVSNCSDGMQGAIRAVGPAAPEAGAVPFGAGDLTGQYDPA